MAYVNIANSPTSHKRHVTSRESVAIHEAGHAVALVALGYAVRTIRVKPSNDGGWVGTTAPTGTHVVFTSSFNVAEVRAKWQREYDTIHIAGNVAQMLFLDEWTRAEMADYENPEDVDGDVMTAATILLRKNETPLRALADELMKNRTVGKARIAKLLANVEVVS